jgi:hypothetical protein
MSPIGAGRASRCRSPVGPSGPPGAARRRRAPSRVLWPILVLITDVPEAPSRPDHLPGAPGDGDVPLPGHRDYAGTVWPLSRPANVRPTAMSPPEPVSPQWKHGRRESAPTPSRRRCSAGTSTAHRTRRRLADAGNGQSAAFVHGRPLTPTNGPATGCLPVRRWPPGMVGHGSAGRVSGIHCIA